MNKMSENRTPKTKTAVLIGGTFNPFTNAHKEMAWSVRREYPEADVIYVPSNLEYIDRWKALPGGKVFSGKNRVDLIAESVKDIPGCMVSDVESTGKVNGRTYITVQYFKQEYDRVIICIGSDKLYEFERWYMAKELMEEAEIVLFTRGESLAECKSEFILRHRDKIKEIEFPYPEVSSSLIRKLFEENRMEEIKQLVPEAVYR